MVLRVKPLRWLKESSARKQTSQESNLTRKLCETGQEKLPPGSLQVVTEGPQEKLLFVLRAQEIQLK